MQALLSNLLLPLALASIMFGMGLQLQTADFKSAIKARKASALALSLQLLLLPLLALLIASILPLTPSHATGLLLVALCPAGATSNLFSNLVKGDLALSVSLTTISSLLSPFLLPILFVSFSKFIGESSTLFTLPLLPTIKKLSFVTLLPIAIGMLLRHYFTSWAINAEPTIKKMSASIMLIIVLLLMITNHQALLQTGFITALAILLLVISAMSISYYMGKKLALSHAQTLTLSYEVGIQNAGTAILVAMTILTTPALATVPLLYGILMNIPAFAFLYLQSYKQN